MVELVREDDQAGQDLAQGGERRLVGDIARGEQQRAFLVMQISQAGFELHVIVSRAGDVARTACASAHIFDRLFHRAGDARALPHAQIVIGAPNHHIARVAFIGAQAGPRELPLYATQIGEHTITALGTDASDGGFESAAVIHCSCTRISARAALPKGQHVISTMT